MKRILLLGALLFSAACEDTVRERVGPPDAGDGATAEQRGVCELARCPKPATGIACCTPDARCGNDPSGLALTCQANEQTASNRKCVLEDCPTPLIGQACCTPTALCGWDPFGTSVLCLPNAQATPKADGGATSLCDLTQCPRKDGGPSPCCQSNGQCGFDTLGNGSCMAPPTCDLSTCPPGIEGGPAACCQANGECGIDVLNIGLCFPLPTALCNLDQCPVMDGGARACCLQNGQCGVDLLGIGVCTAPPATTCDLDKCPKSPTGIRSCCMPNGDCGLDSLGIGVCFNPPATSADGGTPAVAKPPNDPSITGECPSFIGLNGPIWGCCSAYGICGEFAANQCLLPASTQVPPPPKEAGVTESFLRCTPPSQTR